jgi:hypothetical protein
MRLIKGTDLNPAQRAQVLSAFIYRWTSDNSQRPYVYHACPTCDIRTPFVGPSAAGHNHPTVPLETDDQWLTARAFWFLNDGSRLVYNRRWAEPACMANERRQHV